MFNVVDGLYWFQNLGLINQIRQKVLQKLKITSVQSWQETTIVDCSLLIRFADQMCRKEATDDSSVARRVRVDYAPVNARLLLMLLMSFALFAVQLPQPAQATVIRIPTGTSVQWCVINSISVELGLLSALDYTMSKKQDICHSGLTSQVTDRRQTGDRHHIITIAEQFNAIATLAFG